MLEKILQEKSPQKRYQLLKAAENTDEHSLALQKELLLMGDYDRFPQGDLRRIGCYALHSFEQPHRHAEEEQQQMAEGIFHAPRLEACLALVPDPGMFLREYLTALSTNYIRIFIRGESAHMPFPFGLFASRRLPRRLSLPMGNVIRNIFLCPFLSEEEQTLLAGCFYRACYQDLEGRTGPLDENLVAAICALIR